MVERSIGVVPYIMTDYLYFGERFVSRTTNYCLYDLTVLREIRHLKPHRLSNEVNPVNQKEVTPKEATMSKRPPKQLSSHQTKRSNERPSTELDPKMLNIAAGGHFYERAKSRRNRHREVLLAGSGRAVTEEAVPLGLKRKKSGDMREALERLKAGKEMRGLSNRNVQRCSAASERVSDVDNNNPVFHTDSNATNKIPKPGTNDAGRPSSSTTNRSRSSNKAKPPVSNKNNDNYSSSYDVIDLTD